MRFGIFVFTSILIILLLLPNVNAQPKTFSESLKSFLDEGIKIFDPLFRYTLGADNLDSNLFFVKILLFFAMLAILYLAVEKVPGLRDNALAVWTVSIVISILATRFLTTKELVNLVWLPSGIVGISLTSFLPFIIYFFFIESFDQRVIRRSGWILFALIFIGLTIVRWDDLNYNKFNLAWIYIITSVLAFLSFVFDKTIHAKFLMSAIEQKGADLQTLNISNLQNQIQEWRRVIANPSSTHAQIEQAKRNIRDLEKRIRILLKS